jgi:chromosome segregation protein
MENVIFNGTKKRKPSQMAEVSLSFNNTKNLLPTEYATLTVTRKYYRSGDSEYLLNGVPCRLKDITNLFLDTGISSNSYAIIELKMVDDLLNDKDNSRRDLFEEAAGISKFKKRKKETLRRLEDTDADLNRVEDLLFEIEKNMRSLERQAKQTEKYYKLKEEYKKLSLSLAGKQSEALRERLHGLEKEIRLQEDKRLEAQTASKALEATEEGLQKALIDAEKLLSSRQKTLNNHVNTIRQTESDKKIKNERLRFLSEKARELETRLQSDKESLDRVAFSLKGLKEEVLSYERMSHEKEAEVHRLQAIADEEKNKLQKLQQEEETQSKSFQALREANYQQSKALEIKEMQLNSLKIEYEKSSTGSKEREVQLTEFDDKIAELETKVASIRAAYDQKNEEENARRREEGNRREELEKLKEQLAASKRQRDAKDNEYKLTKSLVDNLEGFPEAIKHLKKTAKWAKDTPLLSDLISCDEKYRVPIENYLEHYMNYFVVDHESQALEAIQLLAESNRGKANFFVISKLQKLQHPEFKAPLESLRVMDIIDFEPSYGVLLYNLLGNVYLLDDSKLPEPEENIVFLSTNGQMSRKKAVISGGSVGLFEGKKIGRKKSLESLSRLIKQLDNEIAEIGDKIESAQLELQQLINANEKNALETLRNELSRDEQELSALKSRKDQIFQFVQSEETKREDIRETLERIKEELEALRPQVLQGQQQLSLQEEASLELRDKVEIQREHSSAQSAAFNEQNIKYFQLKNKFESLSREIEFKEQNLEGTKSRIDQNQEELIKTNEEIKKLLGQSNEEEDSLLGLYEEKESIEAGVVEAEKAYYQIRGEISELEKKNRELNRKREEIDNLLFELKSKANDYKLQLQSLTDRLSVEFNIELSQLPEEDPYQEWSQESIQKEVTSIREKMERIGPINPMAMEAYQEVSERHGFITSQKEDLAKAKQDLLNTIEEIDEVAKKSFLEAFANIKENFVKVFRSLFTDEDDCNLVLTDPERPLESPIEITAKPKGKRPLTINQLSGGEKTLTATSLLFAIYLLKPAPFCIFDEVDAPLDDANIDKFNNIIRTFSKDSQFIIVTHNKRTMASTDIIYGITMVEQGVSRVVPVDLREAV